MCAPLASESDVNRNPPQSLNVLVCPTLHMVFKWFNQRPAYFVGVLYRLV